MRKNHSGFSGHLFRFVYNEHLEPPPPPPPPARKDSKKPGLDRVNISSTENFPKTLIQFPNTYEFCRSLYFLIKQIRKEVLQSWNTYYFPGRYPPPSNRYFGNMSRWLLLEKISENCLCA